MTSRKKRTIKLIMSTHNRHDRNMAQGFASIPEESDFLWKIGYNRSNKMSHKELRRLVEETTHRICINDRNK